MINWPENVLELNALLDLLSVRDDSGKELELDTGFLQWKDITCHAAILHYWMERMVETTRSLKESGD